MPEQPTFRRVDPCRHTLLECSLCGALVRDAWDYGPERAHKAFHARTVDPQNATEDPA